MHWRDISRQWRTYPVLLAAITLFGCPGISLAGINIWTSNGPFGGSVTSVVASPSGMGIFYAGTSSGLFKTTDGAASWTLLANGLPAKSVSAIAVDPSDSSTVYAGINRDGLFKSTDGGESWILSNSGLPDSNGLISVTSLAIAPSDPSTLFVVAYTGQPAIFKSSDGGGNWSRASLGIDGGHLSSVAIDPIDPLKVYVGCGANCTSPMFRTNDGGLSWSPAQSGLPSSLTSLAVDPANPSTLFAASADKLFKTTDRGDSWTLLTEISYVQSIAIAPSDSSTLYAFGLGFFKSLDGGASWNAAGSGLEATLVSAVAISPTTPTTVLAGTLFRGVLKTADAGATGWVAANNGLIANLARSVVIAPGPAAGVLAGMENGVLRSDDAGANWAALSAALDERVVYALAVDPNHSAIIYASLYGRPPLTSGIFKSTDAGVHWMYLPESHGIAYAIAIDPTNSANLYAGDVGGGVAKSVNGGTNWTAAPGIAEVVFALSIDPTTPSTVYAGTRHELFKSTDSGATWSPVIGEIDGGVETLTIDPMHPNILYAGNGLGGNKSTDGGVTWNHLNIAAPSDDVTHFLIDPSISGVVYAATVNGVFRSVDSGATWYALNQGLVNTDVRALALHPAPAKFLYAGTLAGVSVLELLCGNASDDPGEQCDDGNIEEGDGCDSNCTITGCGNGIASDNEACDDGNLIDSDGCDSNCTITSCGNGLVTSGELCDDDNLVDGDGCDSNCTITSCGNSVVSPGEACEPRSMDGMDHCCSLVCSLIDSDEDGICESEDPCNNLNGRQTMLRSKLILRDFGQATDGSFDTLALSADFELPAGRLFSQVRPDANGARILLRDRYGAPIVDALLPAGQSGISGPRWDQNNSGTRWVFTDFSGLAAGIRKMRIQAKGAARQRLRVAVTGGGNYSVAPDGAPLKLTLVLGGQASSESGECGESNFQMDDCRFNRSHSQLRCR